MTLQNPRGREHPQGGERRGAAAAGERVTGSRELGKGRDCPSCSSLLGSLRAERGALLALLSPLSPVPSPGLLLRENRGDPAGSRSLAPRGAGGFVSLPLSLSPSLSLHKMEFYKIYKI